MISLRREKWLQDAVPGAASEVVVALIPAGSAFVGRERELAAVTDALSGGRALIVIEGEAGVGKSRLLAEVASTHRLLYGCAPPYRQPYTLAPVIDALRGSGSPAELDLSPLAGALRPLFPEWDAELPVALPPTEDASESRYRLFRALLEFLGAVNETALAVEDVHWADETTAEFLLYLAAQRPLPVSLVLTMRPGSPGSESLKKLTSRPPGGGPLVRIQLKPLDVDDTRRLVAALLDGQAVSDEFARFVYERTDGLPLAVEESLRLMRDRADLIRHGGEWQRHNLREIHVPAAIRDAVLERMARLDPAAQDVLRAAAVLSDPADASTLLTIAELPPGSAAHFTAVESGLLREHLIGRYGFAHALPEQAVYESIPNPERRIAHLRVAEHLATLESASPAVLAHHFHAGGNLTQWVAYTEHAVAAALAVGDEATAAIGLHDLLAHASLAPATVIDLARQLPRAALTTEQNTDLIQVFRRTLESVYLSPTQRSLLRLCLAELLAAGQVGSMCRELETALPDLPPGSPEAVRAMLVLGWLDTTDRPREVRLAWLRRAQAAISGLPLAERSKALRVLAGGLLNLGDETGWQVAAGVLADGTTPPDVLLMLELNLGQAASAWGRYAEARPHLLRALQMATSIGYHRAVADTRGEIVSLDWYEGRWEGLIERAGSVGDDARKGQQLGARSVTALLNGVAGHLDIAGEQAQQVLADASACGLELLTMDAAAALAQWHLQSGHAQDALQVTDHATTIVRHRDLWHWGHELLPTRVAALQAAGQHDDATALVREYSSAATALKAPTVQASLLTCRALTCPSDARAAELFAEAAEIYSAMPRPYLALLTHARQAERLSRTKTGQRTATAILKEVQHGLLDLGARSDALRIRRTLQLNPDHPTHRTAGRPSYGNALSPRELEVVRLVIAGYTNRQIAETLTRSPKTVSSQLSAAMRKLNVTTRTALAVAALEQGIKAD